MDKFAVILISFLLLFLIIFLIDYLFIKRRYLKIITGKKKKSKKKDPELIELSYLLGKFKLNIKDLNLNNVLIMISVINSFIMSFVIVLLLSLNIHIMIRFAIGFVLLFALIYSLYEFYGRYLVRKVSVKNED